MNLGEMRTIVRCDLHDEDETNYRWTDEELERHIARAVKEYSAAIPDELQTEIATAAGSREVDITNIADVVMIEAIEYPPGKFPRQYQRFALWGNTVTMLGEEVLDGSNVCLYYSRLHTLDVSTSTINTRHADLIAAGACGYAAEAWALYAVNKVNAGGVNTAGEFKTCWRRETGFLPEGIEKVRQKKPGQSTFAVPSVCTTGFQKHRLRPVRIRIFPVVEF